MPKSARFRPTMTEKHMQACDKAARRLPMDHGGLAERAVYSPIFPVAHGCAEYGAE